MLSNRSAFVDSANSPLRIAASDIPLPGANDIIVRNHAVAINTIDPAQQGGFQVKTWPIVPGHDLAGEAGLTLNFHIGGGDIDRSLAIERAVTHGIASTLAAGSIELFLGNAVQVNDLLLSGVLPRHPNTKFVSVESGIGWIPFALAALDWQWLNCGVPKEHPEYDLLPSEYFKRQIYGCFWFERDSALHTLEQIGADNVLYETDYPHPTSMSPGPASHAQRPDDYLRDVFAGVDDGSLRKILHDNAARIYHLD